MLMVIWLIFVLITSTAASIDKCSHHTKPGEICKLDIDKVRPTQAAVGMAEDRYESMSSSQLEKYLKKHPLPAYISPDGHFYITDGHHKAKALYDADIDKDDKVVYIEVHQSFYDLESTDEFWKALITNNLVWLYDGKGMQPIDPDSIPESLDSLMDDVYRSLSWMLRCNGGYGKTNVSFADFMWANFLRENIQPTNLVKKKQPQGVVSWSWCEVRPYSKLDCLPDQEQFLKDALQIALKLAQSDEAKDLPGFNRGEMDPPKCSDKYKP